MRLWIPAFAGMTDVGVGMTDVGVGVTDVGVGMTDVGAGMTKVVFSCVGLVSCRQSGRFLPVLASYSFQVSSLKG